MEQYMKFLLLFIYFFSTIAFANHCNSGASHNGPDRQADQRGYMDSKEYAIMHDEEYYGSSDEDDIDDEDIDDEDDDDDDDDDVPWAL